MIGVGRWGALPAHGRRAIVVAALAAISIALGSAGELGLAAAGALAVLAILAGAGALHRRSPRGGLPPLSVVARAPLGRDAGVAVVVWRGAELLVGHGPGGVALLGRHANDEEVAP